ncbi:glutathione S-transferase [Bermanella sp. WJH001]|uniref:glutathione S-transferase n=1 Tax=Bermanella sp. WJH001 TaxID=3048005 RepID=UPI0024BDC82D|nr:glutathione S-transferase [Bermanella sp. WJH001]MDJ1536715.1 glutathione S-transferase [Bermanella sp. WJH001]
MLGVLYSFRRCPYAMRARLAIAMCLAEHSVELREVVLKDKPQAMLDISPKGTVPVLQLSQNVIEESLEIMHFACAQNPPKRASLYPEVLQNEMNELIAQNDGDFKWALDRYKYADRYEESEIFYRQKGEVFLAKLNQMLTEHENLFFDEASLADLAIFPFVRQFAHVDKRWFENSEYTYLNHWLNRWLNSDLFLHVMNKYKQWQPDADIVYFP